MDPIGIFLSFRDENFEKKNTVQKWGFFLLLTNANTHAQCNDGHHNVD